MNVVRHFDWRATAPCARAWLIGRSRREKRAVLMGSDLMLLLLAVWLAFSARLGRLYWPDSEHAHLVFWSAPMIGVAVLQALGLYRRVTRFLGQQGAARILAGVGLAVLIWGLVVLMVAGSGVRGVTFPRSVVFIYAAIALVLIWASRELAALVLRTNGRARAAEPRPVAIFGASADGAQLAEALRHCSDYSPVGFLDDNPSFIGQHIAGLKVYRIDKLQHLISRNGVKEVLLALPESRRRDRRAIIRRLAEFPVRVKTMPALEDIASGRVSVTDLKPVDVEDLLGRAPVPPDPALVERAIVGKAVLVTGAGGSIGAELSRQILRHGARKLVLLDTSEVALYEIETEIRDSMTKLAATGCPTELVAVLGSVLDAALLERTIRQHGIETIYHAAAYKHVPIVEANPGAGLRNNVFGTAVLASVAARLGVDRVTLISTDKAVRPTSVMGASKRLAELVFQAAAASTAAEGGRTIFTMVRFGNVLDSSGSVVRRFRRQIQEGGPVTVTHRHIVRYFMSIPEAAALVVQASAMAKGGEVFVLDMGEPVKIDELARTMISLTGLEVQDAGNPDGDIAIVYTGLRPGEKLYEELLIDENTTETEHPRIRRNLERSLSAKELKQCLAALEKAIEGDRLDVIQSVLAQIVAEYQPSRHAEGVGRAACPAPELVLH